MQFAMRRVLRALYVLLAAATLAGLPVLIIDFKNHDWSVHYKVGTPAAVRRAPRMRSLLATSTAVAVAGHQR